MFIDQRRPMNFSGISVGGQPNPVARGQVSGSSSAPGSDSFSGTLLGRALSAFQESITSGLGLFGGGGKVSQPTADHAQAENMIAARNAPQATADHAQAENMIAARNAPQATADHAQAENMIAAQNSSTPQAPTANVAPAGYMGMAEGNGVSGRGSRGPEVSKLQENLKALGADIEVDGIYGPKTEQAVRSFQEKHNIKVDGLAGPQTRATINGAKRAEAEKKAEESENADLNGAGDGAKAENLAAERAAERAADLNGAGDGAKAENAAAERAADLNGAGDGAKAENAAAERAADLNGAGDGAKAENAAAERAADRNGAGDGAKAENSASSSKGDSESKK